MCYRLTKFFVTMWYTFFGIFDDTSLWILPGTHDPSLCDTPDVMFERKLINDFNYLRIWLESSIKTEKKTKLNHDTIYIPMYVSWLRNFFWWVFCLTASHITVSGTYKPSTFGCSIEALVMMHPPITELTPKQVSDLVSSHIISVSCSQTVAHTNPVCLAVPHD